MRIKIYTKQTIESFDELMDRLEDLTSQNRCLVCQNRRLPKQRLCKLCFAIAAPRQRSRQPIAYDTPVRVKIQTKVNTPAGELAAHRLRYLPIQSL